MSEGMTSGERWLVAVGCVWMCYGLAVAVYQLLRWHVARRMERMEFAEILERLRQRGTITGGRAE